MPRELEIALRAPIGPHRVAEDTIVIDEDGWYRTLTPSSTWPGANEVLFSRLDAGDPYSHLRQIVSEYHQLNLPVSWCVYSWTQPADLGARFEKMSASKCRIRVFLVDTKHPLKQVEGVDVQRVYPDSDMAFDSFIEIMSSEYCLPEAEKAFRRRRYREMSRGPSPRMHLHLAHCGGVPAGCHATIVKEDSGHLTAGCILPRFRAHGVFQSLLSASLTALDEMGIRLATGHSNEKSAFWVDRFGFQTICYYDIYQLDPPTIQG